MPRPAVADIPHTVTTDHRIPRSAGTPYPTPARAWAGLGLPPDFIPQDYHWDLMTEEERREAARDMGVALELAAQELLASPSLARRAAVRAVPLLETAVRDRPGDLRARESLGYALGMLDRLEEARHAYEEVLRIEPHRELALPYLGRTLAGLRWPDLAVAALREVIAVNPWRSDYRLALARYYAQARDWPGAVAACREALRLNPELFEARLLLVQCDLRSGAAAEADAEFRTLLRFYPADREAWQQWYEQQKRAGTGVAGRASNGHPWGV
jgi:tetratricopeptide (TPR) repeat protein